MFVVRVASIVNTAYTNVDVTSVVAQKVTFRFATPSDQAASLPTADALAATLTTIYNTNESGVESALGVTGFSPPLPPSAPSSGPSTALIAGAAAGGLAAVIIIAVVVGVVVRGRKRSSGGEIFVHMNTQMNDLELHLNDGDYRESHV